MKKTIKKAMKKAMKKAISLIILTTIVITTTTVAYAMNFSDVVGTEWYIENLNYVTNPAKKIIDGYPDGTFRPNNKLTVEEFIALILKGDGIKYASQPNIKWSTPYIEKAKDKYLIEDNQFTDYSREITREEMAEIVSNYLRFTEKVEYNQKTY
ncbi:MAG: S-layer homology domain-containing protein, partial [Bacillota bacterium]|nr:S-layer homology domain-containing protein [Bacillota bacterium]